MQQRTCLSSPAAITRDRDADPYRKLYYLSICSTHSSISNPVCTTLIFNIQYAQYIPYSSPVQYSSPVAISLHLTLPSRSHLNRKSSFPVGPFARSAALDCRSRQSLPIPRVTGRDTVRLTSSQPAGNTTAYGKKKISVTLTKIKIKDFQE